MSETKTEKKCSHEGCEQKHWAKGLCYKHYSRLPEVLARRNKCALAWAAKNRERAAENSRKWYAEQKKKKLEAKAKAEAEAAAKAPSETV